MKKATSLSSLHLRTQTPPNTKRVPALRANPYCHIASARRGGWEGGRRRETTTTKKTLRECGVTGRAASLSSLLSPLSSSRSFIAHLARLDIHSRSLEMFARRLVRARHRDQRRSNRTRLKALCDRARRKREREARQRGGRERGSERAAFTIARGRARTAGGWPRCAGPDTTALCRACRIRLLRAALFLGTPPINIVSKTCDLARKTLAEPSHDAQGRRTRAWPRVEGNAARGARARLQRLGAQ